MEPQPLPVARLKKKIRFSSRASEYKTAMLEQRVSDLESLVAKQIAHTAQLGASKKLFSPIFGREGGTCQNLFGGKGIWDISPDKPVDLIDTVGLEKNATIKRIQYAGRIDRELAHVKITLAENDHSGNGGFVKVAKEHARKGLAERKRNYLKKTVSTDELLASLSDLCD